MNKKYPKIQNIFGEFSRDFERTQKSEMFWRLVQSLGIAAARFFGFPMIQYEDLEVHCCFFHVSYFFNLLYTEKYTFFERFREISREHRTDLKCQDGIGSVTKYKPKGKNLNQLTLVYNNKRQNARSNNK